MWPLIKCSMVRRTNSMQKASEPACGKAAILMWTDSLTACLGCWARCVLSQSLPSFLFHEEDSYWTRDTFISTMNSIVALCFWACRFAERWRLEPHFQARVEPLSSPSSGGWLYKAIWPHEQISIWAFRQTLRSEHPLGSRGVAAMVHLNWLLSVYPRDKRVHPMLFEHEREQKATWQMPSLIRFIPWKVNFKRATRA